MITKWEVETFQSGPLRRLVAKKSDHVKYKVQHLRVPLKMPVFTKSNVYIIDHRSLLFLLKRMPLISYLSPSIYICVRDFLLSRLSIHPLQPIKTRPRLVFFFFLGDFPSRPLLLIDSSVDGFCQNSWCELFVGALDLNFLCNKFIFVILFFP